jgi:hypothetical protein
MMRNFMAETAKESYFTGLSGREHHKETKTKQAPKGKGNK